VRNIEDWMEMVTRKIYPSKKENKLYSMVTNFYEKILHKIVSEGYEQYYDEIDKLKDIHKGERVFIVGTGPSLLKTNLKLLKNEIVFGVNTLYGTMSDFSCKYYMIVDRYAWKRDFKHVLKLDNILFLSGMVGRKYLLEKRSYDNYTKRINKIIPLKVAGEMLEEKKISRDLKRGVYVGRSVIIHSIQVAYHLGFNEIYLVGCDCNLDTDKAHFNENISEIPEYEKKKDWGKWFDAYEICKREFEKDGRKIYNSTVGGMLEVFERKSIKEAIK